MALQDLLVRRRRRRRREAGQKWTRRHGGLVSVAIREVKKSVPRLTRSQRRRRGLRRRRWLRVKLAMLTLRPVWQIQLVDLVRRHLGRRRGEPGLDRLLARRIQRLHRFPDGVDLVGEEIADQRSEERRVGKEC